MFFFNEDGTKTVYYLDDAVEFVDQDGNVKEKNNELVKGSDGFTTAQNDVKLKLPLSTDEWYRYLV